MDRWGNLNMQQKAQLLGIYASKGYTDLASIINHYNTFQAGGKLTFNEWKSQMQSKYPDIEMDNTKAGYDYVRYFNDNYDDAVRQLSNLQHFPDTYKLPNHPTFSNESIYSRGPMMGGNWINDSTFSPSIINRQQYPNIYKKDRPYTEREIYGDEYQQGGQLFQKGSYNPPSLFVTNNISISDNTRTNVGQEVTNRIAAKEAEKQAAIQNYLNRRGYLSEDKDKRSYAKRDFDNNVQNIVNTTISQAASPGNIDFNTLQTGISKGLQTAILPEIGHQMLVRPITSLLGLAGTAGSNKIIKHTTPYDSWGNMISKGLLNNNSEALEFLGEFTNPFGLLGGIYGNGVENRVGELLVRRGDSLKNGASTAKNLFKHMFPDVSDYVKETTGFKHPVLRYALDPRQRDLVYRFSNLPEEIKLKPNFSAFPYGYSGNNVDVPFKGDIVDIFFNKKLNNTGFNYVRETPTFFETYMQQNYPYKKPYWFRIGEASAGTPSTRLPNKGWRTDNTETVAIFPDGSEKSFIDPGGFRVLEEKPEITHFADIWKYNGKDALKRYYVHDLSYTPIGQKPTLQSKLYKPIIQYFGDYIDAHSTPIITQWYDTRPLFQNGGSLGKITSLGQWKYPHQVTTIPSNNITMKGVDYPVLGISDTGDIKYMLPNMDYLFDGNYVTEYPINK